MATCEDAPKGRRSKTPFAWYGGKSSQLKHLLPIIDNAPHTTYTEAFGGSGAVLLNKKPSPVEVYNDLHSEVVNFYRVLRDRPEDLQRLLDLTPYSREEFAVACRPPDAVSDVERARLFFVRARQVTAGLATTATPGRWSYAISTSRRGVSATVSKWLSSVAGLADFAERLRQVSIEHLDALDVLCRYDTPETLHYVDPPYVSDTRGGSAYAFEMTKADHERLLGVLQSLKGRVVLSSYDSPLYRNHLGGWSVVTYDVKATVTVSKSRAARREVVWCNYPLPG